jgi:hypothetical protein
MRQAAEILILKNFRDLYKGGSAASHDATARPAWEQELQHTDRRPNFRDETGIIKKKPAAGLSKQNTSF